ncbi:MAG: CRISPR-associated protein Cas4 [Fibrobacteres bacterium]|nr:CRISPR-associated protein Cas4 [Fibrobacterota bacterium]
MTAYSETELLPISAIQHLYFCERQCALIHIERLWSENRLTVEGQLLHERVHDEGDENRPGIRIARGLHLRSLALGLSGVADAVEFHTNGSETIIYPVEYKRGRPKISDCDRVQLCAQSMCLEEMLKCKIEAGAIYYGQPRRREEVILTPILRDETINISTRLHDLIRSRKTPIAEFAKRCKNCSLYELCLPETAGFHKSAIDYLKEMINEKAA